jgi:ribosomal protein L11 methylase PrmA
LVDLASQFAKLLNPGGKIVLSGILISQLNDIQSAYREFFALEPAHQSGDWACIGGRRLS